ncbi:hypothetical protein GCM10009422_18310 [Brevundimonas kwangchunensis]|uniref:HTH araC/xylS-type domain-containing protein n=1 Tax=Brevundimonas kwangchunensis TaxID=322163 RepID=A0ABP3S555_9CAUL
MPDAFDRYLVGMAGFYEVSGVSETDRNAFFNRSRSTISRAGMIGRGHSVRQTLSRGLSTLRSSDVDGLNLIVNGAAVVGDADGRDVRAAPGAVQFRDLGRQAASRLDRVDLTVLVVPRTTAPPVLLAREVHGLVIPPDQPGARLLRNHLSSLEGLAADLPDEQLETGIQALLLIALRLIGGTASPAPEPVAAALYRTVRTVVARHVDSRIAAGAPAPDSLALARAAGVSRATLYRAFDAEGGVVRYIRERRLHHARTALRLRHERSETIASIAERFGFASATHFSRQFRERFGYLPSEVAPPVVPVGIAMSQGPIRHDLLVEWLENLKLRSDPR